jgi:two-component system cell cycle sensor histidine kinase/response regulator CckA
VMVDADLIGRCPALNSPAIKSGNRMVRLTVSDDGPGMETAIRERIFEPFFTTKPVDQGTGLGLAVVHGIVQAHHGIILADSQPGNGAVFTIYLPPEDCCTEHKDTADVYSDSATTGRPAEDHKLVYIDDDPAVMNILCRLFEGRGIRVSGFTNQQLALDYIRNNADTIDVVVTDNNMPGMQGLDVARAIREIHSELPVAVISGLIDEDLQEAAELAGVRELINKPFTVEKFLAAIRRMTQHR